ncbi:hypothetical protein MFIFM68171_09615 [Madurella fahalii]|uniref:Uncharacterized protein n=1 Tax=Madurella fahalii TaxID=1157608 RepID=A0ABQ0GNU0_9PEZI
MPRGDVIARIYAYSEWNMSCPAATKTIDDAQNSHLKVGPGEGRTSPSYIELTFGRGPETGSGYVFGTGTKPARSGIVIPQLHDVDTYHCALTFENDFEDTNSYRLVLRDLGSRHGTAVKYGDAWTKHRRNFRWILGRGSFGQVKRVWDVSSGAVYAQKELHISRIPGDGARNRETAAFMRELEVLRSLDHERIVRYAGCVEPDADHGSLRILMECCECGSLAHAARHTRPSRQELIMIIKQVAEGLVYLHDRNIAHRDLKLQNIFLKSWEPLAVALGDFGLAKPDASSMLTQCGTPFYMAPEAYLDTYGKAVDIWSLGVTALQLLLGTSDMLRPIQNISIGVEPRNRHQQLISRAAELRYRNNSDDRLLHLLRWMLEMKPEDRPTAMECLKVAEELLGSPHSDGFATGSIMAGGYSTAGLGSFGRRMFA